MCSMRVVCVLYECVVVCALYVRPVPCVPCVTYQRGMCVLCVVCALCG